MNAECPQRKRESIQVKEPIYFIHIVILVKNTVYVLSVCGTVLLLREEASSKLD